MSIKKNDFVEIEYIGKVKDGEIFDTNIESEIKKMNLDISPKPFILCIGQNLILPAIDEFLIGKEQGKYTLELPPEKAFGFRKKELIKTVPMKVFQNQNSYPQPGMVFSFDNAMGKVSAVSGGRVIVDFNNPIAGKEVVYEIKVLRILDNQEEKIKSLFLTFFGQKFEHKIDDKKLVIEAEPKFRKFIELFKPKFKEILNLDLEASESKDSDGAQKSERTGKISDIVEKEVKQENKNS